MTKLTDVPHLSQPAGSAWCGPACAGMVHEFHSGFHISLDEIAWRMISRPQSGANVFEVASWFHSLGYKVSLRGSIDSMFDSLATCTDSYVETQFRIWIRMHRVQCERNRFAAFVTKLYREGGKFTPKALSQSYVHGALDRGLPVIAVVDAAVMVGIEACDPHPHYIVITGASRQFVWYHDPANMVAPLRSSWKKLLVASKKCKGSAMIVSPKP